MSTYRVKKDPQAELDYGFKWDRWLQDGDTIQTSTWEVTGDDNELILQSGAIINDNTRTMIWLIGGTKGKKYQVTNRIETSMGRKDDRTFTVTMTSR